MLAVPKSIRPLVSKGKWGGDLFQSRTRLCKACLTNGMPLAKSCPERLQQQIWQCRVSNRWESSIKPLISLLASILGHGQLILDHSPATFILVSILFLLAYLRRSVSQSSMWLPLSVLTVLGSRLKLTDSFVKVVLLRVAFFSKVGFGVEYSPILVFPPKLCTVHAVCMHIRTAAAII